jgi:hypothetical protein
MSHFELAWLCFKERSKGSGQRDNYFRLYYTTRLACYQPQELLFVSDKQNLYHHRGSLA